MNGLFEILFTVILSFGAGVTIGMVVYKIYEIQMR